MTPRSPDQLDLAHLPAHAETWHEDENTGDLTAAEVSRLHAKWHHYKKAQHTHGGDVIGVEVAPDIFAVHPEGYFTGEWFQ